MTASRARPRTFRMTPAGALVAALVVLAGILAPSVPVHASPAAAVPADVFAKDLREDLEAYLRDRGAAEHVSAAAVSVNVRGSASPVSAAAGTMTFGGSKPVPAESVWQIGSNTKAFTSVLLLRLEAEGRLSIDDPLGKWLPQYQQWRHVTIRRLLNMTSGIPTYDAAPAFWRDYVAHRQGRFTAEQLVRYVTRMPATTGWSYSNTNYVLAEMIIERVTGRSYRHELETRLLDPLDLDDLHYRQHRYPGSLTRREPGAYFFDRRLTELAPLIGKDVSRDTLSGARGAGGIIGTTGDMTRWERALYSGRLLPHAQQAELTSLVSTATGKPIEKTSAADPSGFGLGVAQLTVEPLGTFWSYEGGTVGFRTLHVYLPSSGVIFAMGLNSHPAEDRIVDLAQAVYETLVEVGILRSPVASGSSAGETAGWASVGDLLARRGAGAALAAG